MYPNRNPYKYCKLPLLLYLGCRVDSKSWRLPVVSKDKAVSVLFADPLKRSIRRWNVELHRKRVENIGLEKLKRSMSHVTNTESGGCECCVLTTDIAWRDCARYPFIKCIGDRVMIVTADSRLTILESFIKRYFHINIVKYNKKLECYRLVLSLCCPCGDGNNVTACVRTWMAIVVVSRKWISRNTRESLFRSLFSKYKLLINHMYNSRHWIFSKRSFTRDEQTKYDFALTELTNNYG